MGIVASCAARAALVLAIGWPCAAAAACSHALHLSPEHWPPYSILKDGKVSGMDVELVAAILGAAGCGYVIDPPLPIIRRQSSFTQGKVDLMLAASRTPEREREAWLSLAYRHEDVGLFALPAQATRLRECKSFDALLTRQASILVPKLGWYGLPFAQAQPRLKEAGLLREFTSFRQALSMLAAGRATLVMGDAAAVQYEARQQGVAVVRLPVAVVRDPVHLMLNRERVPAADLEAINAAIIKLERDGTLRGIRHRYGLP